MTIVSIFFILMGGFVIFMMSREAWICQRCRNWPTTPGQVESKDIKVENNYSEEGQPYQVFTPRISYRYTVDGVEYTSSRRCFGDYGSTEKRAERVVRAYTVGQTVSVHYDPQHPEASVLEPGANWAILAALVMGVVFFIIGILGLLGVFPGG